MGCGGFAEGGVVERGDDMGGREGGREEGRMRGGDEEAEGK